MRKLLTKTSILAALAVMIMTATAYATEIGTGVVDATSLRLRNEPSLSSSTVTYLPGGAVVSVHEQLDGWYKVVYNGMTGYVSADYLVYTPTVTTEESTDEPVIDSSTEDAQEETQTMGTISGNNVNFRTQPMTSADIIGKLAQGTEVEVLSVSDGWCEVRYDGVTGYVAADYVEVDGKTLRQPQGMVTGSCVNIRSGPTTGHGIIAKVYAGEVVDLLEKVDNWYRISYNGYEGYIREDFIREYTGSASSAIGDQVVALAMNYLGVRYVYGGASPNGFDCSGFTMYIFKQFGYNLPHSATSQWYESGQYVERSDLQPGDIVLFCDPSRSNGKACSHVGIYIGNGEFIHASSGSSGKYVRISSLNTGYYNTYYKGAKRLG